MVKIKYYAVHNGREGTQIYTDWDQVRHTFECCLSAADISLTYDCPLGTVSARPT